jgi:hypothetical protein
MNKASMASSNIDRRKIPYQLPQPTGMVADIVASGALTLDGNEQEWVPQAEDVAFKPLILNVTAGYYVNLLRVRASDVLSRHRQSGPVHAFDPGAARRRLGQPLVARGCGPPRIAASIGERFTTAGPRRSGGGRLRARPRSPARARPHPRA